MHSFFMVHVPQNRTCLDLVFKGWHRSSLGVLVRQRSYRRQVNCGSHFLKHLPSFFFKELCLSSRLVCLCLSHCNVLWISLHCQRCFFTLSTFERVQFILVPLILFLFLFFLPFFFLFLALNCFFSFLISLLYPFYL